MWGSLGLNYRLRFGVCGRGFGRGKLAQTGRPLLAKERARALTPTTVKTTGRKEGIPVLRQGKRKRGGKKFLVLYEVAPPERRDPEILEQQLVCTSLSRRREKSVRQNRGFGGLGFRGLGFRV